MGDFAHELADLLLSIEAEMRRLGLWQAEAPREEALHSTQPFSIDTLDCEQWLQWVFIPRMKHILEQGLPLPQQSDIRPYFEECLADDEAQQLLVLLGRFDELIDLAAHDRK